MSNLFIVATPLGNLKDITLRALEALGNVDFILCEDTRVTKKLLEHYSIKTPVLSYHQHSLLGKIEDIMNYLREGKDLAVVSDAGTPGISDPGNKLVEVVVREFGDKVKIISIPGPSAVTAAASISGFPMDRFMFMGFPPAKNKRQKFFREVISSKYPVLFYESPHRIIKTLKELEVLEPELVIFVGRELTKQFEEIFRGKISEVLKNLENRKILGEFVVAVMR